MAMIAAATAALGLLAGGGQMIMANQQTQHAKGAAEAQATAMDAQAKDLATKDAANLEAKRNQGAATQNAAIAAIRASMSAGSGMGGTILGGGAGTTVAPTAQKTLLGA